MSHSGVQGGGEDVVVISLDLGNCDEGRVALVVRAVLEGARPVGLAVSMRPFQEPDRGLDRCGIEGDVDARGLCAFYAVVGKIVMPWGCLGGARFLRERVLVEELCC